MGSYYLEIGDPPDLKQNMKVKLSNVSFGVQGRRGSGGFGANRVPEASDIDQLHVWHETDNNSPDLLRKNLHGTADVMRIYFYKEKEKTKYLTVKLEGARISSIIVDRGEGKSTDLIEISFNKIEYKYDPGYVDENDYRPEYTLKGP